MQGGKWLETSPLWCIWRLLHLVQKKICENIVQAININWKLIPIANWPWKKWSLLMIPPNFSWELISALSSFFKIGTSTFVVETNYTRFLLDTIRFAGSFVSNNSLLRNPQQTPVARQTKAGGTRSTKTTFGLYYSQQCYTMLGVNGDLNYFWGLYSVLYL